MHNSDVLDAIPYGVLLTKWMEALKTLDEALSGGKGMSRLKITKVIFNEPATIVFWSDGTKTVVKCCEDDTFDKEKGLAMAILKKLSWNDSKAFHRGLRRWIKPEPEPEIESSISKPFANWGEIVRRRFNDYINQCLSKADSEEKEYTIICPCCSNRIYIPSKYEFFNNGGTTRCAKCGLEIHMSSEKEDKSCRPENTEK